MHSGEVKIKQGSTISDNFLVDERYFGSIYFYVSNSVHTNTWRNQLTVRPKIIVHYLEQREAVPRVWCLLSQNFIHVFGKERPEDLGVLHHKIAKPGERLRYSVVGADRENIGRRTYTVGTFLVARGDGDATLSTGPSRTQKTLLLP